ncbi:MAG: tRNA dihydrouridine(20/20a) synthase DusA [Acidobacteria bacterium]|nr:MAG: tRNA dihydrouridine(20/20a) synthase DusA [Acidobacteriota bacterium]
MDARVRRLRPGTRGEVRPLAVAPMMDRTDRFFRRMFRAISRRTLLYTEMITTGAVLHGDRDRLLGFDPIERPLALQLGGDDPDALARCAEIAEARGFDEVDLNVGCPSERVQRGRFGACLMAEPERVARAVAAMRSACGLPVTVKHRIGIDERDSWDELLAFVDTVAEAGCDRFIVHARKAWLSGLSPADNRSIPPLRPDLVRRLARARPGLAIEYNGGVRSLDDVLDHLQHVTSVMVGRAAWDDPFRFGAADRVLWGETGPLPTRRRVLETFREFAREQAACGTRPVALVRPLMGLARGCPGGRRFRRVLGEAVARGGDPVRAIDLAAAALPAEILDCPPPAPRPPVTAGASGDPS